MKSSVTLHSKYLCLTFAGTSYVFVRERLTWSDAQSYCRLHHTDLVMVRNSTEDQQINAISGSYVWIGLSRARWGWSWSDGSSSSFSYWAPGMPEGKDRRVPHCLQVVQGLGGRWNDEPCSDTRPFFCHGGMLICVCMCVCVYRVCGQCLCTVSLFKFI